ncbi:MAG: polysaccharide biosynthesis tyrosine autokinase, partial [Chloroflexi bacterium]|nr:polysaccharide biosynthesis tyrosine autokinase [Chloroflexota bacterium]
MELIAYWEIVRRRWWWLVLGALLGAGVAFGVSRQMTPLYEASTTVMVGAVNRNPSPVTSEINVSQDLAATYGELLKTYHLQSAAMASLGYAGLPDVTIQVQRDTQFVVITVRDPVPQRSVAIADALVDQLRLQLPDSEPLQFAERQLVVLQQRIEELQQTEAADADQRAELDAAVAGLRQQYTELYATYSQNRASVNTIDVVDPARLPTKPVSPKTMQNTALAAVLGLMLAAGAAVLAEYLHNVIERPGDVTDALGLPYLASVGLLPESESGGRRERICVDKPQSPHAEAFRFASVVLRYSLPAEAQPAIMVTSGGKGEGKTTLATCLAIVEAQAGKRVILVDADLRLPDQHEVWGLPNDAGLSSLLTGQADGIDAALHTTSVANLRVLTAGPKTANPTGLVSSSAFARLIADLGERADMVIVDTPPVLSVADTSVMARAVSGVVLVVRAGVTTAPACAAAADLIARSEGRLLGVFVNALKPQRGRS